MKMSDALGSDAAKLRDLTGEQQFFMVTCDDCGGEGGEEVSWAGRGPPWDDGADGGDWIECQTCHGSGSISNHEPAPELEQDDLIEILKECE